LNPGCSKEVVLAFRFSQIRSSAISVHCISLNKDLYIASSWTGGASLYLHQS